MWKIKRPRAITKPTPHRYDPVDLESRAASSSSSARIRFQDRSEQWKQRIKYIRKMYMSADQNSWKAENLESSHDLCYAVYSQREKRKRETKRQILTGEWKLYFSAFFISSSLKYWNLDITKSVIEALVSLITGYTTAKKLPQSWLLCVNRFFVQDFWEHLFFRLIFTKILILANFYGYKVNRTR